MPCMAGVACCSAAAIAADRGWLRRLWALLCGVPCTERGCDAERAGTGVRCSLGPPGMAPALPGTTSSSG